MALLEDADLRRLDAEFPAHAGTVRAAAEPHAGYWLVRNRARPSFPDDLREWLAGRDAYDGAIDPDLHARAIVGLLHQLPLRSFVIDVSGRDRQSHAREVEALLDRHLGVGAAPTS